MFWFWWWLIFMLLFFFVPLGYGWGYRRWGPPYPSWTARARAARESELATWGLLADLVWVVLLIGVFWLILAAIL